MGKALASATACGPSLFILGGCWGPHLVVLGDYWGSLFGGLLQGLRVGGHPQASLERSQDRGSSCKG